MEVEWAAFVCHTDKSHGSSQRIPSAEALQQIHEETYGCSPANSKYETLSVMEVSLRRAAHI